MDRIKAASEIIKKLNLFFSGKIVEYDFIKEVCIYFDSIKKLHLSSSDLKFLKYLSNIVGIPHYYDLLFNRFGQTSSFEVFDLNTFSSLLYETSLHIDENIKIHKYQKQVLDKFKPHQQNRLFLSASTSFGKTFLIYEIIKKRQYKNIALLFPTIALLSENHEKLIKDEFYLYFSDFALHTLSDVESLADKNIYLFTPERYLSFLDKNINVKLDFVFVDEIYKIDNEYESDQENKENERDIAYRIALQDIVKKDADIFLVGPYVELANDDITNQSFNVFLHHNKFSKLDYNAYEIVGKEQYLLKNKRYEIDTNFTLNFGQFTGKGNSKVIRNEKLRLLVNTIRDAKENVILYCKQKTNTEKNAKELFTSDIKNLHCDLIEFIDHLEKRFSLTDDNRQSWIVINALKQKIAIHHGDIPKYIQKEIINFFNLGYIDVLISTTTITEGVNTSAKNLIVLDHKKGTKILKTFDAKNIVGRAGRFLYHYSGRIFILDKNFQEILEGSDDPIQHKNYDVNSQKDEIDYFITDDRYLKQEERNRKENILAKLHELGIPEEIISSFKVISYSDKLELFKAICELTDNDHSSIKELKRFINTSKMSINYKGMQVVLDILFPIIQNENLRFLISYKGQQDSYSVLITMLSSYLNEGFLGSIRYNINTRGFDIDKAIREASKLIFNMFKYQLVKYLGVFNLMYKYYLASTQSKRFDEVIGIDKLLLKLEYNASSEKGRLASDYGVPNRIIDYYENDENIQIKNEFDNFEKNKFDEFENLIKNNLMK